MPNSHIYIYIYIYISISNNIYIFLYWSRNVDRFITKEISILFFYLFVFWHVFSIFDAHKVSEDFCNKALDLANHSLIFMLQIHNTTILYAIYVFDFCTQPNTKCFWMLTCLFLPCQKKQFLEDLKTVEPICQIFV